MLVDKIKLDLLESRKLKTEVKSSVLRVLLGEIELVQSRTGVIPTDESIYPIIRKMITSNNECYAQNSSEVLLQENTILDGYLPQQLSQTEICNNITDIMITDIKSATDKDVPKLIGLFVKTFKTLGFHVSGNDIKAAILKIRGE